jgi:hypothetical protein
VAAMTAHLMVGDHSAPGPAASAAFQRSITRVASSRAPAPAALDCSRAAICWPRVRTPMAGSIDEVRKKGET